VTKIAHLILAHRAPTQLARLVDRIKHPEATIFIHIDLNCNIQSFTEPLAHKQGVIFLKKRQRIQWGGFSMVKATLMALNEIQTHATNFSHINLLSESDYPLTPVSDFHAFLSKNPTQSFLEFEQQGTQWWDEARSKVLRYHLTDSRFRGKHLLEKIINQILPKRSVPMGATYVGRSQWFTLYTEHVNYIRQFVIDHPEWARYFKYTWGADEIFFHTILFNSPHKNHLVNNNLRYIDWSENTPSPKILTKADWLPMTSSGKFFARKFDISIDASILDELDRLIGYN